MLRGGRKGLKQRALPEQLDLCRLIAARLLALARQGLALPWHGLAQVLARVPSRLMIAPQDIRTADPTIAEDIYSGYFAFGGKMINAHGVSPFELDPPSPAWAAALAGFGWLRHLRAADTALARSNARALVDDFITHGHRHGPVGDHPAIAARRLLSWLSQSPIILEGADRGFYQRFMKSLSQTRARLQRQMSCGQAGEAALPVAIALASFALCAKIPARAQRRATQQLAGVLDRQILADGGHVGRNPRILVDLLLDLLPLRQAYAARGQPAPQQLLNSIDRMMPMLRLFRQGDSTLALFNGMGVSAPDSLATVLAYDDAHAGAMTNARPSGYQRIESGTGLLIMDAGPAPSPEFSRHAHAGCLSFEFSSQEQRLVVNCGAPGINRADAIEASRTTAAHSTLVVDDTSSCTFARSSGVERLVARQILSGPRRVTITRSERADATEIEAAHNGYVARFGLLHARRITLSHDGAILRGEDRLRRTRKNRKAVSESFEIRFHLHPAVTCQRGEGGVFIDLTLANGERWRFENDGMPVDIEDSIFFAAANGPRACAQIVIKGIVKDEAVENWAFIRMGGEN